MLVSSGNTLDTPRSDVSSEHPVAQLHIKWTVASPAQGSRVGADTRSDRDFALFDRLILLDLA